MAIFEPGKPVITKEPSVTVDNKLEPGTYRFQLVLIREDGTESQPVFQDVTIVEEGGSLPVIRTRRSAAPAAETVKKPKRTQATKTPDAAETVDKPKKPKRTRKRQSSRSKRKPEA